MAFRYQDDRNVGLPSRFTLSETGAFNLQGGTTKVQDNMNVLVGFIGHFRIYCEDFVPDVLWLLQKTSAIVQSYKVLILGRLARTAHKYLPFVTIEQINTHYDYKDRKEFGIAIQYTYNLEPDKKIRTVEFINV